MNEQPQWKLRVCEERKKSEIYREDIFNWQNDVKCGYIVVFLLEWMKLKLINSYGIL